MTDKNTLNILDSSKKDLATKKLENSYEDFLDFEGLKKDFPIFADKANEDLIYLDSTATTQKPQSVLSAMEEFYKTQCANPLRGLYELSNKATAAFEAARHTVASFIGALDCEVIFTRNTTESLNLLAFSWGLGNLKAGDEVAVGIWDHHSVILPWQFVCQKTGAKLVFMELDESFELTEAELSKKINERTKVVCTCQISNVLGSLLPVKKLTSLAHKVGAIAIIDGAQSAPHIKIDVKALDTDFFAFSGHKMLGPMGIGVLYGKKSLLLEMEPFMRGGEMIEYVKRDNASWAPLPHKFEAGTPNCAGAVGLAAAIKYLEKVGVERITAHDEYLTKLLVKGLTETPFVKIVGSKEAATHHAIASFVIEGVHPHDVATILDSDKIAVRAGHHCAEPLHDYLNINATTRASVYLYNTKRDIEQFLAALKKVREYAGF